MGIKPKIDWGFPEKGSHPGRRVQAVEIAVFLFLIVPSLAFSFFVVKQGRVGFTLTAVATVLRDLALVGLVVYFLWRNGESVASIGWRARQISKETAIGLALFVPVFYFTGWLEMLLKSAGFSTPATPRPSYLDPAGRAEIVLAFVLVVVVAVAEETIFRGYLLMRFEGVGLRPVASVLLSASIFALGHGYEGPAAVASIGVMGLILAIVYLWRRSLVAPMVMHFLQDFVGLVLLPLLRAGQR